MLVADVESGCRLALLSSGLSHLDVSHASCKYPGCSQRIQMSSPWMGASGNPITHTVMA
jgi:hypothetical protein